MRHTSGTQAKPRPWHLLLCGLLLLPTTSGCNSAAGTGAAAGGLLGAGIGGLVGRSPGAALVGGALGAGAGLATGAVVDAAHDKKVARDSARAAVANSVSLEDVAKMTQANVSDEIIIDKIRQTNVAYSLTGDQLVWLKQQGVSDRVVRAMQTNGYGTPVRYAAPPPVVVYERPVYVAPPPPPVAVGVGVRF
jgi:hypothetical protein